MSGTGRGGVRPQQLADLEERQKRLGAEALQRDAKLASLATNMQVGFGRTYQRLDSLDGRFDGLQTDMRQRFDDVDRRFDAVDARFEAVDRRFDAVDDRLEAIDDRLEAIAEAVGAGRSSAPGE